MRELKRSSIYILDVFVFFVCVCVIDHDSCVRVISIKFFLVISMLIQPLRSWELRMWSPKVNFLDILITSPQYFYKKGMGTRYENFFLILGVKGLKSKLIILNPFFCSFYSLEKLSLKDNCLSDVGVKKITLPQRLLKDGLGKLSVLDFSLNPGISDSSVKHLIKINSLTALNLSGTGVTFRCGVPQLVNQTNLCLSLEVSYSVWLPPLPPPPPLTPN